MREALAVKLDQRLDQIAGPLAGVLLLSLNALLSAREVLSASPALTLRDSV